MIPTAVRVCCHVVILLVGWLVGEVVISVGKSVIIVDDAVITNTGRSKAVMLRIRESEKSTISFAFVGFAKIR